MPAGPSETFDWMGQVPISQQSDFRARRGSLEGQMVENGRQAQWEATGPLQGGARWWPQGPRSRAPWRVKAVI